MNPAEIAIPRPGDFCLLCGEPPAVIGIFRPDDPEAFGAPAGKIRLFRYCLCSKCQKLPDTPERVEKIIRAELTGGGAHYV